MYPGQNSSTHYVRFTSDAEVQGLGKIFDCVIERVREFGAWEAWQETVIMVKMVKKHRLGKYT